MPDNPGGNHVKEEADGDPVKDEAPRLQPDRITVALIPQSAEDLQHLQDRTSLSKTNLVNRAITLYGYGLAAAGRPGPDHKEPEDGGDSARPVPVSLALRFGAGC